MTDAQGLTISIVSHGHREFMPKLLGDLDADPFLAGVNVLVTLNLADEPFDASPYRRLKIEVIRNATPLGFGANHNQAFRRSRTPWFAIVNPDLRVPGGFFSALAASARAHPEAGLLAPRVTGSSGIVEDSVRRNLTPWDLVTRVVNKRRSAELALPPPGPGFRWYAGMCYLVQATAFAKVYGFDERYFLYCEDYDLCARLHLAGTPLLHVSDASVIHDAQRDSHRLGRHLKLHLASILRVWRSAPVWKIALEDAGLRKRRTSLRGTSTEA